MGNVEHLYALLVQLDDALALAHTQSLTGGSSVVALQQHNPVSLAHLHHNQVGVAAQRTDTCIRDQRSEREREMRDERDER